MNSGAAGRPAVVSVEYDNIKLTKLVSVYKQAYIEAGFNFRKQATGQKEAPRSTDVVELVFEFSVPEYPHKPKAVASFVITATYDEERVCAPCSVRREFFGVVYTQYDAEESEIVHAAMKPADSRATGHIRRMLGKSLPDM